jgi:2-polyprenyl-3-methyl-5-hydroxy-6-metoxy-1,4-benzoquinol methylase
MKEFWDKRYSEVKNVYGREPNKFFKEIIDTLTPEKLLMVGEGEGRNGIYAAKKGWKVDAVDYSEVAKSKAEKFAAEENVQINYSVADISEFNPPENAYDAVGIIYLHLDEDERIKTHQKLVSSLKPSGKLIAEVFDKEQIKMNSGGPKNIDLLYSLEDIVSDFQDLDFEKLEKLRTDISEGKFHTGEAIIIRFLGSKPAL